MTPRLMNTLSSPIDYSELGLEVSVAEIEKQLRKLWDQDEARTNASLINLVVFSEKPGALFENSAIIRELTRDQACRAILVEINRAEQLPTLRSWITAHCHLAHGLKSVCCEQIAFYLTGTVTGRFRNTVFSHLNSDLPLVFWWQGELSDILTERLVSVMDRLIIDSSSWADSYASFRRITDTAAANHDLIIQDLEWTRSWQFRLGVASLFDDPTAQKMLPEIDSVEIQHHPAHRNAALQLLAWIADRATWQVQHTSSSHFKFQSASGRQILAILSKDASAPAISSLTLRGGDSHAVIRQLAAATHVHRQLKTPVYEVSSLAPVDPASTGELVSLQLARGGRNSLFQKILPRFIALLKP